MNHEIYLHLQSFINIVVAQEVKNIPRGRHGTVYLTDPISCLLIAWQQGEPGYLQLRNLSNIRSHRHNWWEARGIVFGKGVIYFAFKTTVNDVWGVTYQHYWRKMQVLDIFEINWRWYKSSLSTYFSLVLPASGILTHWGRDKMAAISQTIFSNGFPWMKMYEFWLKFHWILFLTDLLTIFQHWFR